MLGALTGCNLPSAPPPVTYVIITATHTPSDNPAPIATESAPQMVNEAVVTAPPVPTSIPTPAPNIDPAQTLSEAQKRAHDGYYEDAMTRFAQVVNAPASAPEQVISAAVGYAEVALREGGFESSLAILTDALTRYPDTGGAASAYFLRGEANLGLGRWTSAINDYRAYLGRRPGVIDSYVHERIADAFLALNMSADAQAAYGQATAAGRARVPWVTVRERAAQVYLSLGQPMLAMAEYDAIVAQSQNRAYQADISLRAAHAARAAADSSAPLRYKTVFESYPDTAAALPAMAALSELGVAVSNYDKGRAYFYAEDYAGAIQAFNDHTTSVVLMDIPAELYLLLGRAYREIGNNPAALVAFKTIVEQYPTSPLFGDAVLEQGRTHFVAGDNALAIQTYLGVADTYPTLQATAAEALWRAGYLHSQNGATTEALTIFARLSEAYPVSQQAVSGAGIAAAAALAAGDSGQAEQWYARLAAAASGETQADAYWQVAKLAERRGAGEVAQAAYRNAINANPDGYTAARIRERQTNQRPFQTAGATPLTRDETADRATAEAWIRTTFGLAADAPLGALPGSVLANPAWLRGAELWALGQYSAAEVEFIAAMDAFEEDGVALYGMSLALKDLGAYYPSQQAAANLITAADAYTLTAPVFIGRLRFPAPYPDLMQATSNEYRLDPLLLLSMIRNESLFDTYATAAAGEKGMTQVIPPTADYIAGKINWPDYQHEDLFRPYAGITFGAVYLEEQLTLFDGNAAVALSAYNAGPGRGITWRDASNGATDFDAFLNAISISSTRGYVQRIYTFYSTYRQLYAT
jgi:soluble lytic murein transglycosylase